MAHIFSCLFLILSSGIVFARLDTCKLVQTKVSLGEYVSNDSLFELLSDNASFFAQLSNDGAFRLWSLSSPDEPYYILMPPAESKFGQMRFSSNSRFVFVEAIANDIHQDSIISVINISTKEKVADINAPKNEWGSAIFDVSLDEKSLIYASSKDMTWIEIYDLELLRLKSFKKISDEPICAIAIHPSKESIAIKSKHGGRIDEIDINSGTLLKSFIAETDLSDKNISHLPSLLWNKDGSMLATYSTKANEAVVWDVEKNTVIYDFTWIDALVFAKNIYSATFFIGSIEGDINIISPDNMSVISSFDFTDLLSSISESKDQKFLVVGSSVGELTLYDSLSLNPLGYALNEQGGGIDQMAFKNERLFYTLSDEGGLSYWNIVEK
jgi:WD40 repeat protein